MLAFMGKKNRRRRKHLDSMLGFLEVTLSAIDFSVMKKYSCEFTASIWTHVEDVASEC